MRTLWWCKPSECEDKSATMLRNWLSKPDVQSTSKQSLSFGPVLDVDKTLCMHGDTAETAGQQVDTAVDKVCDPVHTACVGKYDSVRAQKVCTNHGCVMRRTIARTVVTSVGGGGARMIGLPRWECGKQTILTASLTAVCEVERFCDEQNQSKKVENLNLGIVRGVDARLDFLTTKPGGKRPRD